MMRKITFPESLSSGNATERDCLFLAAASPPWRGDLPGFPKEMADYIISFNSPSQTCASSASDHL